MIDTVISLLTRPERLQINLFYKSMLHLLWAHNKADYARLLSLSLNASCSNSPQSSGNNTSSHPYMFDYSRCCEIKIWWPRCLDTSLDRTKNFPGRIKSLMFNALWNTVQIKLVSCTGQFWDLDLFCFHVFFQTSERKHQKYTYLYWT